jgi:two-component sensor histidine kinase
VSLLGGQKIALLAVAVATLVRLAATPFLGEEVSFIAGAPAVLLSSFFGGRLAGLTTILFGTGLDLLISGKDGATSLAAAAPRLILWLFSAMAILVVSVELRSALETVRRREKELRELGKRLELVVSELEHRGRNALAIVDALSSDVALSAGSVPEYRLMLSDRLRALSMSYAALTRTSEEALPLCELIDDILRPFGGRVAASGPPCRIAPNASLPLSLALHELATNATKYGALSQPGGRVTLSWSKDGGRLRLIWSEVGGPAPASAVREGFGSQLLRTVFRHVPGGDIQLARAPQGLICDMALRCLAPSPAVGRREGGGAPRPSLATDSGSPPPSRPEAERFRGSQAQARAHLRPVPSPEDRAPDVASHGASEG